MTFRSKFIRDCIATGSSQVALLGSTLLWGILVARELGPAGKGLLAWIVLIPTLAVTLLDFGVRQATVYFVGRGSHPDGDLIGAVSLVFVVTAFTGTAISAVAFLVLGNDEVQWHMILLALLILPLSAIISYTKGILAGKQQMVQYSAVSLISAFTRLFAAVLFVKVLKWGVEGALTALSIGLLPSVWYALRQASRMAPLWPRLGTGIAVPMLRLGIVYAVALFVSSLNYRIAILLLQQFSTAAEIGQYSLGANFGELVWQIPGAMSIVLFSRSANASVKERFSEKVVKSVRVLLPVCVLAGGCVYFAAGFVIPIVYGDAFRPACESVRALIPGIVLMVVYKVLNSDLAGKGRPWLSLFASVPGLVINALLCILWVPGNGAVGASWASSIAYCTTAVIMVCVYSRAVGIPICSLVRYRSDDFDFLKHAYRRWRPSGIIHERSAD